MAKMSGKMMKGYKAYEKKESPAMKKKEAKAGSKMVMKKMTMKKMGKKK
jgi:hypothetical protein